MDLPENQYTYVLYPENALTAKQGRFVSVNFHRTIFYVLSWSNIAYRFKTSDIDRIIDVFRNRDIDTDEFEQIPIVAFIDNTVTICEKYIDTNDIIEDLKQYKNPSGSCIHPYFGCGYGSCGSCGFSGSTPTPYNFMDSLKLLQKYGWSLSPTPSPSPSSFVSNAKSKMCIAFHVDIEYIADFVSFLSKCTHDAQLIVTSDNMGVKQYIPSDAIWIHVPDKSDTKGFLQALNWINSHKELHDFRSILKLWTPSDYFKRTKLLEHFEEKTDPYQLIKFDYLHIDYIINVLRKIHAIKVKEKTHVPIHPLLKSHGANLHLSSQAQSSSILPRILPRPRHRPKAKNIPFTFQYVPDRFGLIMLSFIDLEYFINLYLRIDTVEVEFTRIFGLYAHMSMSNTKLKH